ncbi:Uncharacterised protein [Mycobacteroides abscessus subsp. abscessus]|nr:Uncharacterised protein [Mycobacteroides abscessus subsp. abscessus]
MVARWPILWLRPTSATSLRVPSGRYLGTMNSEMPLTPGLPPGALASTRCTMFSPSSWSPPEIHILVPVMR